MIKNIRLCLAFAVVFAACTTTKQVAKNDDGKIEAVFVQVNDVYEIAPVAGGTAGGMARVATLKKQEKQANSNTFLIMAGDFLSPSVFNSLKYKGERIRGAQMVDAMNSAGTDIAIFGNHEFDITENELQQRIDESAFKWVASNTFHKTAKGIVPFARSAGDATFPDKVVLNISDADGTRAKIGIIGLTLPANKADFVAYTDAITSAKKLYDELKDTVDAVVAITHQTVAEDVDLAHALPNLAVILGGHEHSGIFEKIGNIYITKAEANARTAYVVKLSIDKNSHKVVVKPEVKELNNLVPLDSATNVVVSKWSKIAEENYSSLGFDPKQVVLAKGEALEGRESFTRSQSTNLTRLVAKAMEFACPKADVVIYNSGSIRLDDVLTPPITQYDILRSLPFGGPIVEADMLGSLLLRVLNTGLTNTNSGGYLQWEPVVYDAATNAFLLNGTAIDPNKTYRVAMTDFLFTGKEARLDFLNPKNPQVKQTYPVETNINDPRSDIRMAIIRYLEQLR